MEEAGCSPSVSTKNSERKQRTTSSVSRLKKYCLYFGASLQEGFTYIKAFFIGQTKKIMARNEKEATAADLETAKMQVEAADAAEEIKTRLNKSA